MKVLNNHCPKCQGILVLSYANDKTIIVCCDCDYKEEYKGDRRRENKAIEFEDRRTDKIDTFFGGL